MPQPKRYAAVFTDSRPLMNLDWCIRAHMRFLPRSWDCLVFTCRKNSSITKMGAKLREIPEETTDSYLKSNEYRTSPDLWLRLQEYDRVLIFEQDTRILRSGVEEFLKWDYIGAPWPGTDYWNHGILVGNGGLSIRNPAIMLKIAQAYKLKDTNEDVFFAHHTAEMGGKLAPLEAARKFSCERIFALGTFGCHAIAKHMTEEQINQILTQYENPLLRWLKKAYAKLP